MVLGTTATAAIVAAILFGWAVPLLRLFDGFQPMTVALSIIVAALLVRLNRGMPTLDWKSLRQDDRERLTGSVLALTKEYVAILAINVVLLVVLVSLMTIGKVAIQSWTSAIPSWTNLISPVVSGAIGALVALCLARMIWRDFDIVRLQKKLLDAAGERDQAEAQSKIANEKMGEIRASSIRRVQP